MKNDIIEKEITFLYEKHNKTTKYKLEKQIIDFPENIKKILSKKSARTKREKQILDKFRKKILYDLFLESLKLERIDAEIRSEKNRIIQEKIKATRIENMKKDPNYVCHFGIWINKEKHNLNISRDTYAIINKKNSFKSLCKRKHRMMLNFAEKNDISNNKYVKEYFDNYLKVYEDDTFEKYTDDYCINHQRDCLENYDLNMKYYNSIDYNQFNNLICKIVEKYKFEEVNSLDKYENKRGIYILILDKYKQIYIGQAIDLKKRIAQHWRSKKEFDRLIFGGVHNSIISIDSFGAYDTTRIFVLPTNKLGEVERQLTEKIPKCYQLNRTSGGTLGLDQESTILGIIGHANKRNFNSND